MQPHLGASPTFAQKAIALYTPSGGLGLSGFMVDSVFLGYYGLSELRYSEYRSEVLEALRRSRLGSEVTHAA